MPFLSNNNQINASIQLITFRMFFSKMANISAPLNTGLSISSTKYCFDDVCGTITRLPL